MTKPRLVTDGAQPPCFVGKTRAQRDHRHAVTIDGKFALTDRCLSQLLWLTVARAVVQEKTVTVSGVPVEWDRAKAYTWMRMQRPTQPKWWRDLTPPTGVTV